MVSLYRPQRRDISTEHRNYAERFESEPNPEPETKPEPEPEPELEPEPIAIVGMGKFERLKLLGLPLVFTLCSCVISLQAPRRG